MSCLGVGFADEGGAVLAQERRVLMRGEVFLGEPFL
jgi:hypothetical protein